MGGPDARPPEQERDRLALLLGQLTDANMHFPERPRFVEGIEVFDMPDGLGIQFRGAEAPVLLRGRDVADVLAYLREVMDGTRTLIQLLEGAPHPVGCPAVARTLLLLHSRGLISGGPATARDDGFTRRQQMFWGRNLSITRSAASGSEIDRRMRTARVGLFGCGMFGAVTADVLRRSGFENVDMWAFEADRPVAALTTDGDTPMPVATVPADDLDAALALIRRRSIELDLLITATVDAPRAFLLGANDICQGSGTPWLAANVDGSAVDIGPLTFPGETACYRCLALRQASAAPLAVEDELFHERLVRQPASKSRVAEALWPDTLAASLIAGEAMRAVTGIAAPTLTDAVLRVLPLTGYLQRNEVRRLARCPGCYRGEVNSAARGPEGPAASAMDPAGAD